MENIDEQLVNFGEAVRQLREAKHVNRKPISQEKFALRAGIDRSYYGRIERGQANPTLRQVFQIAEALGIPVTGLFRKPRRNRKVLAK